MARDTHIMLENLPIILFSPWHALIPIILLLYPKIILHHEVEPRPGENKNFIYIMDVELEISSRFSILFEICIMD
jgi:hypothetical protein